MTIRKQRQGTLSWIPSNFIGGRSVTLTETEWVDAYRICRFVKMHYRFAQHWKRCQRRMVIRVSEAPKFVAMLRLRLLPLRKMILHRHMVPVFLVVPFLGLGLMEQISPQRLERNVGKRYTIKGRIATPFEWSDVTPPLGNLQVILGSNALPVG